MTDNLIAAMMVPQVVPSLEAEVSALRAELKKVTAERDEYRLIVYRLRGWAL